MDVDVVLAELVKTLASDHLGIETLEVQGRDWLDFHEVSVVGVRRALELAFEAGRIVGPR